MDQADISNAIQLFEFSRTAFASPRATFVVRRMKAMARAGEIGFFRPARRGLRGQYGEDPDGPDLRISSTFIDGFPIREQLGALSLELVHEGTHAGLDTPAHSHNWQDRLLDEMAARQLPVLYFRELTGPGVFNEAEDPPRPGRSSVVFVSARHFDHLVEQSTALSRDQLIDYVLDTSRSYRRPSYIDAQWIANHHGLWRGLANRWPVTKGLYLTVLSSSHDRTFTRLMVDILESVTTQADFTAVLDRADREAVDKTRRGNMPNVRARFRELSADPALARRITALERRWNVSLTAEPARP